MKTVTMWNVPVDIAKAAVKAMREKAATLLTEGSPIKEVDNLTYYIQAVEESIQAAEDEDDETSAE